MVPSSPAPPCSARNTTSAAQLADAWQLGSVGPPGERGAHGLEQLPALESEPGAQRLNRGFNTVGVPQRKLIELRGEGRAQRARRRRRERRARGVLELEALVQ